MDSEVLSSLVHFIKVILKNFNILLKLPGSEFTSGIIFHYMH